VCGGTIERPEDGFVEWLHKTTETGEVVEYGPRLVHVRRASPHADGCKYDERRLPPGMGVRDHYLSDLLGPDGLTTCLAFLTRTKLPVEDVGVLIMRLHLRTYEKGHRLLADARQDDAIPLRSWLPARFAYQEDLLGAMRHAKRRHR
jgi:hypothetical protein